MATLYLIRHGQASFMQDNYDKLSPLGIQQSKLLGCYFGTKSIQIDAAFTGNMQRQKDTYRHFKSTYTSHGLWLPDSILLPELDEHQFTEVFEHYRKTDAAYDQKMLDGLDKKAVKKLVMRHFFKCYRRWLVGELDSYGFESWEKFKKHVEMAFSQLTAAMEQHQTVAVFSSGGVISYIVGIILELKDEYRMELNWQIRNSSITELNYAKNGKYYLRGFNLVAHLEDGQVTYV